MQKTRLGIDAVLKVLYSLFDNLPAVKRRLQKHHRVWCHYTAILWPWVGWLKVRKLQMEHLRYGLIPPSMKIRHSRNQSVNSCIQLLYSNHIWSKGLSDNCTPAIFCICSSHHDTTSSYVSGRCSTITFHQYWNKNVVGDFCLRKFADTAFRIAKLNVLETVYHLSTSEIDIGFRTMCNLPWPNWQRKGNSAQCRSLTCEGNVVQCMQLLSAKKKKKKTSEKPP